MFEVFERALELDEPDLSVLGTSRSSTLEIEDNGAGGVAQGVPLFLGIKEGDRFTGNGRQAVVTLTLDEATKLRNILNEAIVWAEGALAG